MDDIDEAQNKNMFFSVESFQRQRRVESFKRQRKHQGKGDDSWAIEDTSASEAKSCSKKRKSYANWKEESKPSVKSACKGSDKNIHPVGRRNGDAELGPKKRKSNADWKEEPKQSVKSEGKGSVEDILRVKGRDEGDAWRVDNTKRSTHILKIDPISERDAATNTSKEGKNRKKTKTRKIEDSDDGAKMEKVTNKVELTLPHSKKKKQSEKALKRMNSATENCEVEGMNNEDKMKKTVEKKCIEPIIERFPNADTTRVDVIENETDRQKGQPEAIVENGTVVKRKNEQSECKGSDEDIHPVKRRNGEDAEPSPKKRKSNTDWKEKPKPSVKSEGKGSGGDIHLVKRRNEEDACRVDNAKQSTEILKIDPISESEAATNTKTRKKRKKKKTGKIKDADEEEKLEKASNEVELTVPPSKKKKRRRSKKKRKNSATENCEVEGMNNEDGMNKTVEKKCIEPVIERSNNADTTKVDVIENGLDKREKGEPKATVTLQNGTAEPSKPRIEVDAGVKTHPQNLCLEAKMKEFYKNKEFKDEMTKSWNDRSSLLTTCGIELLDDPFRACFIPNFFRDRRILEGVKEELSNLKYNPKDNDLYKFSQTSDLKSVKSPYISSLKKFLYGDFRKWLSEITGIELTGKVDMGSSKYGFSDVLLCHDDELDGRRIAYILYLTPPWYEKDGGSLDLFDVDSNGEPRDVVKSFLPHWNSFAFFEVSPVSFHQVREISSKDKVRLSINGWFHGPNIERPPKFVQKPRSLLSPGDFEEEELYRWLNPTYLEESTQKEIRKKFKEDSEILLDQFLCKEKYDLLCTTLNSFKTSSWISTGPANKQSCKILKQNPVPDIIQSCIDFFRSDAMFVILSDLTGLKLHRLAASHSDSDTDEEEEESSNSEPGMTIDIRKWSHGSYTLLRDCDQEKDNFLDATLSMGVPDEWSAQHGGFTTYVAKDEDEELLTVLPRSNSLALIFRDADTLKFHKYVNTSVKNLKEKHFFDINCTYRE